MKRQNENEVDPFDEIRKEVEPPVFLKDRLLDDLRSSGHLNKRRMNKIQIFWAAATLAALAIGYIIGQQMTDNIMTDSRNQYVLFLYENEEFKVEDGNTLVQEYTDWATELAESGHLINAEKLNDNSGEWLGESSTENRNSRLSGYFIYAAGSFNEALSIAKTHPHVGYGGGMEVREIEKLN